MPFLSKLSSVIYFPSLPLPGQQSLFRPETWLGNENYRSNPAQTDAWNLYPLLPIGTPVYELVQNGNNVIQDRNAGKAQFLLAPFSHCVISYTIQITSYSIIILQVTPSSHIN